MLSRVFLISQKKRKTSETRIKTGARRFSKYVQTDWQSCKIKVGQRGQALNEKLIATKIFLFR
jgi:hypothetical protein